MQSSKIKTTDVVGSAPGVVSRKAEKVVTGLIKLIKAIRQSTSPLQKAIWNNKLLIVSAVNAVITSMLAVISLVRFKNFFWLAESGMGGSGEIISVLVFIFLLGLTWQTYRLFFKAKNEKWDKTKPNKRNYRLAGLIIYLIVVLFVAKQVLFIGWR